MVWLLSLKNIYSLMREDRKYIFKIDINNYIIINYNNVMSVKTFGELRAAHSELCVQTSFTKNVIFLKDKTTIWWKTREYSSWQKKIACANASSGNMLRGLMNESRGNHCDWNLLNEEESDPRWNWGEILYHVGHCIVWNVDFIYEWQIIWYVLKGPEACQASFSCF